MPGVRRTQSKPAALSEAAELVRSVARNHIDTFIQQNFRVTDFAGKEVDFKYKWGQRQVAKILQEMERARIPVRVYVLKSRQIGLTTMTANRNFVKIWANNNRRAVTIAHLDKRASEILGKLKFAYSKLPAFLRFELSQDSKHELGFADFNSKMYIASAATIKSIELARGDTIQDIHASELTRWADPEHGLFELQQVCHAVDGTSIVIETTGKQYGSYAHQLWRDSKAGKTRYRAKFLPWQEDPECDLDGGKWTDEERDRYMKEVWEYEPQLLERAKVFNLSPGHTYWAYLQLRYECLGNFEKFLEDYPCTDEEAWRSKGQLYFDGHHITKLMQRVADINYVGFNVSLNSLEEGFSSFGELQQSSKIDIDSDDPHILVWRLPQAGRRYVVSGDSSSGTEGGDPSSSFVIDMYTGEMMAEFHGLVKPHQHARMMASLGTIYFNALAAPEVNSMGLATLQDLLRIYPYIFLWRLFDDVEQKVSKRLGWYTSPKSRGLMLALLARVVEEAANDNPMMMGAIRSPGLVNEMRTFLDDPIKPQAQKGTHDDRIMALAIAWYVAQLETRGAKDDILSVLRPTELHETAAGLVLANNMTVEDALAAVKKQLRMQEY
jgi:hypothetical protein